MEYYYLSKFADVLEAVKGLGCGAKFCMKVMYLIRFKRFNRDESNYNKYRKQG